ncbi:MULTISPECIES: hypothetical protein [unclassified Duganella]|jgi:hypothetical protein|uniref:hypothetical protein n=1 Tax=unclassified Duganella TaxID=2636909 RepID=UPI00088018A8|nr:MULTISPECIES: hypothetical protein [unclassified Duganella]SDF74089.1 hypothetical protein SAMN05216320_1011160 [Duganella sp. OV458]SDI55408.1 hypothetical protein SAMN05428973_101255 [Duganella sp. OV510]
MLLAIQQSGALAVTLSRVRKAVVCVCIALFLFQLGVTAGHRHEATESKAHCVLCHAATPALGDLPAAGATLLAIFLAIAYVLARLPEGVRRAAPAYLRPASQGPPASVLILH